MVTFSIPEKSKCAFSHLNSHNSDSCLALLYHPSAPKLQWSNYHIYRWICRFYPSTWPAQAVIKILVEVQSISTTLFHIVSRTISSNVSFYIWKQKRLDLCRLLHNSLTRGQATSVSLDDSVYGERSFDYPKTGQLMNYSPSVSYL